MTKEIIIPVCLFIFTSLVAWVLRIKAKADKAEIKDIIAVELKVTMRPLEAKVEDVERTSGYLKAAVNSLETNNKVWEEKFKAILEAMERHSDSLEKFSHKIEEMIERQDDKSSEKFLLVFDKIEKMYEKISSKADK